MISYIGNLDTNFFLFLNSFHSPFFDSIMLFFSYSKISFFLLFALIFFFGIRLQKKLFLISFVCALIGFGISDSMTSRVLKPGFKRLRPCKEEKLKPKIHLAGQRCWGSKYGFVSSHASNSFAIATFFWLLFRVISKRFSLLFLYSFFVAYSRIYLSKHYPLDIFFGALFGIGCGYFAYKLNAFCHNFYNRKLSS